MQVLKKAKEDGLSLKTTSILMMIVTMIITVGLLVTGFLAFRSFRDMEKATEDFIVLEEAANDLMSASDYLTEEVQSYTVIGERVHLVSYFTEARITRRRENAIYVMEDMLPDSQALAKLKEGMAESQALMEREYYAMRLILEAQGDPDIPDELKTVALSAEDSALSKEEKILLAQRMVHDSEYYEKKNHIRNDMNECIEELKNGTHGLQQESKASARKDLIWMIVLVVLQAAAMFLMMWLITHLGVNPVLRAVDHIKKDENLEVVGASEFRYLAGTYNVMYSAYKKSIENLSFKACHDELTGTYNRAGYDLIRTSLDMRSTAVLVFDVDQFKEINDKLGHEAGDRALVKVATVMKNNFRADDYICRIGGDEFVVFMVHVTHDPGDLIKDKVKKINQDLAGNPEGLPPVTMSAGAAYDPECKDASEMFRRADTALYYVKENGRDGCCIYSDELKGKNGRTK